MMIDAKQNILDLIEYILDGQDDYVANLANISAAIYHHFSGFNWAGFYRAGASDDLILGPFQGKVACDRIKIGSGVVGTAFKEGKPQNIADVRTVSNHIICDSDSVSECVIPIWQNGRIILLLDIDSPLPDRFGQSDYQALQEIAALIGRKIKY
jgi:GAF domain-containing protein